jgi:low affinity Fe/Cu permease
MGKLSQSFRRFAEATARYSGKPAAFLSAAAIILVWALTGPIFNFNDTWQLVINTGTTIITFLMVFLIQNSQNRESAALQIKLDELIRATEAHNGLLDLEDVDEETLDRIRENYRKLANQREQQAQQERSADRREQKSAEADEACVEMEEIDRELKEAREKQSAEGNGGNSSTKATDARQAG